MKFFKGEILLSVRDVTMVSLIKNVTKVASAANTKIGFAILLTLTPQARRTVNSEARHILFTVITVANKTLIGIDITTIAGKLSKISIKATFTGIP